MIAKVIVYARNRNIAIQRMQSALEEMIIETSLDQIEKLAQDILEGQVRGRVVVNIQ